VTHNAPSRNHIIFWNKLRVFAVLAVVVQHASVAYSTYVPWWYVTEQAKSALCNLVLSVTDGFTMPVLFFIAGYFALPSLGRHGPVGFMAGKLKRLGIPLVALTICYCPIISYVDYLDKGGSRGYLDFWLGLLPSILDWRFDYFVGPDDAIRTKGILWSYHLWFLALLLVFCGGLAAWRAISGQRSVDEVKPPTGAGLGRFLLLALGVGLVEGIAQAAFFDPTWARFGPFLVFQPARAPLYVGFFLLGVYGWKHGWSVRSPAPGHLWIWGLCTLVAYVGMAASAKVAMVPGPKPWLVPVAYGLARTAFGLAATGLLMVFGQRRLNRPGRISASLSAASYDLYLGHFPPLIVLQYLLARTDMPVLVKFVVVILVPVVLCWGGSRLAGQRRRLWVPTGVAASFAACLVAWG
jgi:glucans biosynthesis protein C